MNDPTLPSHLRPDPSRFFSRLWCLAALLFSGAALAAESGTRNFDVPAGDAAVTLKAFSEQSGQQVVFMVDTVRGERTNAVRGAYVPRAALDRMLAGSRLVAVQDEKTQALAVQRSAPVEPRPVVAPSASVTHAAATGQIEGRVINARNGAYLDKVRVTVDGTALETLTDASGEFRLTRVPAGPVTVRAFYTGLAQQAATVIVSADATVQRDFSLGADSEGIVKLAGMVVTSSREMDGAAIAINEQRFASNIVNVVSADEFGSVLESNPGDFLKYLPGITIDFIGGAARSISMGGVPPEYVPITVGGFDVSSVAGGGTARSVDFHTISMNNIARIEAIHSPTPESPGSALAGSVNMIPRSAFDRARPAFNYSVFLMMRDNDRHLFSKTPGPRWINTRKVHPGFEFSYIKPVNDHFGFTLTGSNTKQYTEEARTANTWRGAGAATNGITASTAATQYPDTTPDKPYLGDYVVEDGGKHTSRTSLAATIDYRFTRSDRLSLSYEVTLYDSPLNQRTISFFPNRISPGDFSPTFTHGQVGRGEVRNASSSRNHQRVKNMPTLTYRHDGPIWKADAGLGYANERLLFRSTDKGFFNNVVSTRQNVTISFDDNFYLRPGRITVTDGTTGAPVDIYNLDSYVLSTANATYRRTTDVKRSAFASLRRDFDVHDVPVALKGGIDVRQSLRDDRQSVPPFTFVGADGRASTSPAGSDDRAGVVLDDVFSQRVPPYGFPKFQYVSTEKAFNLYQANPSYFTTDLNSLYRSGVTNSKHADEIVSSAYLRADAAFFNHRLKLVGGVRAEQTNVDGEGPLTDPTRNFQRDAAGNVLRAANGTPLLIVPTTNALGVSQLTFIERGMHAKKEYLRLFPNLNASYNLRENLIARAAYYTSVGRPNFNQYAGGLTLPDPDVPASPTNRITVTNATIKAWSAQTVKVRLEYYFEGVGQVSIGAFQREFKNFFGSTVLPATPEFLAPYGLDAATYGTFDVATQYNLPNTVRMSGLEFDYKQALTFLPPWARGVQVFANASALRATGDDTADFAGYVPRSYNWGLSLSRPKYNVRVNWNYRGRNRQSPVTGRGIEAGTFTWGAKGLFIDVQAEYYLTKQFGLFANLRNVDDATADTKIFGPSTPLVSQFRQRTTYGSLWSFGVKGTF